MKTIEYTTLGKKFTVETAIELDDCSKRNLTEAIEKFYSLKAELYANDSFDKYVEVNFEREIEIYKEQIKLLETINSLGVRVVDWLDFYVNNDTKNAIPSLPKVMMRKSINSNLVKNDQMSNFLLLNKD